MWVTHSLSTGAIGVRVAVKALLAVASVQSSAEFGASPKQADLAQRGNALTSPTGQVESAAQPLLTVTRAHAWGHLGYYRSGHRDLPYSGDSTSDRRVHHTCPGHTLVSSEIMHSK
ncbi:putative dickkopf-related protein 2-like, partial [Triplophysa rosa]